MQDDDSGPDRRRATPDKNVPFPESREGHESSPPGEITEAVEDAVEALFETITSDKPQRRPGARAVEVALEQFVSMRMETFSGPLPPPAVLERYAALYPDAPRIIFTSFDKQGEHRRTIEDFSVRANARRSTQGLWLGFFVTISFLFACAYLILEGHEVSGVILGVANLAALAGVFVYGSQQQRRERERKNEDMTSAASGTVPPPNQVRELPS